MSPEPDGSYNVRIEGTRLVCGEKGHNHECKIIVAGFRVMLLELRKRDQRIKELQEEILKQEVGGLFKEGN